MTKYPTPEDEAFDDLERRLRLQPSTGWRKAQIQSMVSDTMIDELETENRLLRARNTRLMNELNAMADRVTQLTNRVMELERGHES